ncbi:MAG: hypothetical protein OXC55_01150 [Chloroflexi bacterium]|nr:hypothetical protein [Chloroflexota bacterium]
MTMSSDRRDYAGYFATMDRQATLDVVRWALQRRPDVSDGCRDNLNEAISTRVPINGFRGEKAPDAPVEVLIIPVSNAARTDGFVANAIFGVWWESQGELRDIVSDALIQYADEHELADEQTKLTPDEMKRHSEAAASVVLENHPEVKRDDARLMAFLVFNQADIHRHEQELEEALTEQAIVDEAMGDGELQLSPEGAELFDSILKQLEGLPADAPDWDAPLIRLMRLMDELRARKLMERDTAATIGERVDAMIDAHIDIFTYFEWDPGERLPNRSGPWKDVVALGDCLDEVDSLISEYIAVREQGKTYSEEVERSPQRMKVQENLLAALENLEHIADVPVQANPDPGDQNDGNLTEGDTPSQTNESAESLETVEEHRRDAENAKANLQETQIKLAETEQSRESVIHERDSLRVENDGLRATLFERSAEVKSLREAVRGSPAVDNADAAPPDFVDVAAVLDFVDGRWPEGLRVVLNSSSDRKLIFDRPNQLYAALEWLATTYRSSKMGDLSVPDFKVSLAEACGWDYVPRQSEVTMGKYRSDYETTDNGIKFRLEPHIGRGVGGGSDQIRVAFAWDAERQLVVVGYVGRHQTTGQS